MEPGSLRSTLPALDALAFVALGRGELERARELLERSLAAGLASGALAPRPARALGPRGDRAARRRPGPGARAVRDGRRARGGDRGAGAARPVRRHRARAPRSRPGDRTRRSAGCDRVAALLADWPTQAAPGARPRRGPAPHERGLDGRRRAQSLEAAIAGWDALGRTWEGLWARLDLAACLLRANRDAEAVALVRERRGPRRRARQPRRCAIAPTSCSRSPAAAAPRRSRGGRSPPASSRSRGSWRRA